PPAPPACLSLADRGRRAPPASGFIRGFAALVPGDLRGDVLDLLAPNAYVKNWLSSLHMELLPAGARQVLGRSARVRVKINRTPRQASSAAPAPDHRQGSGPRAATHARAGRRSQPTLDAALGASP